MGKETKRSGTPESTIKLTLGEILLLHRRKNGLNQSEMAKEVGLTYDIYRTIEYDLNSDIPKASLAKLKNISRNNIPLETHEECFIRRRRSKIPQWRIAKDIKVSRYWLGKMERGEVPSEKLQEYWT